ncbi:MAG: hypothetical protein K1Y36_22570, partial [Blastocatellia bacterium]|nr:hypothetical protein [Blastocatellia bacterium]
MNCGKLQRGILLFKLVLCLIGMTFVPVAGHSQELVSKFAPGHLPQRSNAKASLNPSIPLGLGMGMVLDVEVNPTTNRLYTLTYDVAGASNYLFSVLVFEGTAPQPLAMIPVGTAPTPVTGFSLRVNHTTNKIYAGSPGSLTIIDGGSNSVLASLPGSFGRIEVNSVTNRVYATQTVGNSMFLTVIDGQTNNVLTSFPVQGQVVAVNSATNRVYVSVVTTGLSEIQVFDGGTNTLLTRIPNLAAYRMAINPLTNRLYVSGFGGAAITVLEGATHTVLTTIPLGPMAKSSGIVANPNTNRVYVFTHNENFAFVQGGVRVIDGGTNTVLGTLKSSVDGRELTSAGILKINPATGVLYLNKDGIPTVLTATESASAFTVAIQVDCVPFSLALNPVTRRLYVANYSGRTLFILNPENGQVLANLALGWSPGTVLVNAVTNRIYLRRDTTGTGDSASVVVLDGATL